jgi:hypothetical protein
VAKAENKTAASELTAVGNFMNSILNRISSAYSERSENDGPQKSKGCHHSQHIEFKRQTHQVPSELLTTI